MVPRVHINLSAPGTHHLTLAQFGLKLLTVGGLAVTVSFLWASTTLHKKIDDLENQTYMIVKQTGQVVAKANAKGMDLSNSAIQKIPQHISFVKHVRERVGFSWTQLLTDLESAVPGSLMMRAVSLDEKTNTVLLNGSTQSLQDLNRLIHQLEKHQAFHDVILTQHAKKKKQDTTKKSLVVFSMKVSYDPTDRLSKMIKS
jgi:Tfp pilus assembly protein PilN